MPNEKTKAREYERRKKTVSKQTNQTQRRRMNGPVDQVLPIPDEEVVQKIHQNFRITFLKDALLRPMMDDAVVGTLNSLTYFNNTEIVQR